MKTTRTENKPENSIFDFEYPKWPDDGNGILKIEEWTNGEGFDFIFPDGTISLTPYELDAMLEIKLKLERIKMMDK